MAQKRRQETQLTKDVFENSSSSNGAGNRREGGPDDTTDPTEFASSTVMSQRKIAPLKKRGGGARGGARGGISSNLPNFFAGAAPAAQFGSGQQQQQNGAGQQQAIGGNGFNFGGATPAPTPPAQAGSSMFGSNMNNQSGGGGGFGFGGNVQAQEQPKVNPFASLAPQSNPNSGMFGSQPQQQQQEMFGTQPGTPGGGFGNNGITAGSTGGLFGNNGTTNSPFSFGGNTQSPAPTGGISFNKAPEFNFGSPAPSSTPNMFGSNDTKSATASTPFTFGSNTASPAPSSSSPFTFGAGAVTAPSNGGLFGSASSTPPPEQKPAEQSKPSFQFGSPMATSQTSQQTSMFEKPTPSPEPSAGVSLFGAPSKPTPSPEPPATTASTGFFGATTTAGSMGGCVFGTAPVSGFTGFGTSTAEKTEGPPKSTFGGFGGFGSSTAGNDMSKTMFGKPADLSKSAFGSTAEPDLSFDQEHDFSESIFGGGSTAPKKEPDLSKSMFGSSAAAPATNMFGGTTANGLLFGSPPEANMETPPAPPAEKSPEKRPVPSFFNPPATITKDFAYPTLPVPSNSVSPPNLTATREISPPSPPGSSSWSPVQLTEYHNFYALRALNHSFKETLIKSDQMADWSAACAVYTKEAAKIRSAMEKGEKYLAAKAAAGAPGKRASEDSMERDAKRRKDGGEESTSSTSSKALASILGGGASTSGSGGAFPKLTDKPAFGFKPPTVSSPTSSGPELLGAPVYGFTPPGGAVSSPKAVDTTPDKRNSENAFPKLTDKPVFGFKPPTVSSPTSSGPELLGAPVFGFTPPGGEAAPKKTEPAPNKINSGSVFDTPMDSSSDGGFVNPFMKSSDKKINYKSDAESDNDDEYKPGSSGEASEEDEQDVTKKEVEDLLNNGQETEGGSLFDRITPKADEKKPTGFMFGTPTKSPGMFGNGEVNQTWTPDRGVKFGEPTTPSSGGLFGGNGSSGSSIFGQKSAPESKAAGSNLFGNTNGASPEKKPSSIFSSPSTNGTGAGVGFSFGGSSPKPIGPISMPSASSSTLLAPPSSAALSRTPSNDGTTTSDFTTPGASDSDTKGESSEPSDTTPLANSGEDLSAQGPGEEDEDSLFQVRTIVYEMKAPPAVPGKLGVGTLRVLKNRINGKSRLLVRTEGGKVIINVGLRKKLTYSSQKKSVTVPDFLEGGRIMRYSLRVKEEANATKLAEALEMAKKD